MTSTASSNVASTQEEEHIGVSNLVGYITLVYLPILWFIGTLGNTLSLCVFSRKGMRTTLTYFLFRCLALFDLIVIQEAIGSLFAFFDIYFVVGRWGCRLSFWILFAAKLASAWVLVAIAIERLIGVVIPLRAKVICTIKKGKVYVVCATMVALLCASHNLFGLEYTGQSYDDFLGHTAMACVYTTNNEIFLFILNHIYPWFVLCIYSLIPSTILFISNLIICYHVLMAQRKRQVNMTATLHTTGSSRGITAMLVTVSVAFLVLTTPWCAHLVMSLSLGNTNVDLWAMSYVLMQTNHGINIFLYFLTGSTFRHEFREMFLTYKQKSITADTPE